MRTFYSLGILATVALVLVACAIDDASQLTETEHPEVVHIAPDAGIPEPAVAADAVIRVVAPLSTAEPERERPYRSYPAPTGYPGFRKYYQMRCYPGCHSYPTVYPEGETAAAQPTATPTVDTARAYRSYPAPTGAPGFRKYYQIRCYPGCHSYSSTPEPARIHP
jgi:hypothetical protein